jgi:Protein tyrosine and serine/threonine kinase
MGDNGLYMASSAFPVRWTAPETLLDAVVTKASDCYSLGVTLHEVFSFAGELPYNQHETNMRVIQFVGDGGRMTRPTTEYLPNSVWDVTQSLWVHNMLDRLTASQAATKLSKKSIPEASAIDAQLKHSDGEIVDMQKAQYARLS